MGNKDRNRAIGRAGPVAIVVGLALLGGCGGLGASRNAGSLERDKLDRFFALFDDDAAMRNPGTVEALSDAARVIKKKKVKTAQDHYLLGLDHFKNRRLKKAEEDFRRATEIDPRNTNAYIGLGNINDLTGRTEEAELMYRKVLAIDPDHLSGHILLGQLLEKNHRRREAADEYRKALAIDPKSPLANMLLGRLGTGRRR